MMMNTNELARDLEDLLRRVLADIIREPAQLQINTQPMARSVTVFMAASPADTPRIIGQGGAHYRALCTLAVAMGRKHRVRVEMDRLAEPAKRVIEPYPPFTPTDQWGKMRVEGLLLEVAQAIFEDEGAVDIHMVDGPNGSTNVDVLVAKTENSQTVADVGVALTALFKSIGKANGRRLFINVVPDQEPTNPQAPDSRHRFCTLQITRNR